MLMRWIVYPVAFLGFAVQVFAQGVPQPVAQEQNAPLPSDVLSSGSVRSRLAPALPESPSTGATAQSAASGGSAATAIRLQQPTASEGAVRAPQGAPSAVTGGVIRPSATASDAAPAVEPAAAIVEAMQTVLKGYRFNKRLFTENPQDHWLVFSRGNRDVALVGWTETGQKGRLVVTPASPMPFIAFNYKGQVLGTVDTLDFTIGLILEAEPRILIPERPNAVLAVTALAQTMPAVMRVRGPQTLELTCEFYNPTEEVLVLPSPDMGKTVAAKPAGSQTITKFIEVGRSAEPIRTGIGAMGIRQAVTIEVENPLELTVRPEEPRLLSLDIGNTGGEPFQGEVLLWLGDSTEPFRFPLDVKSGQRVHTLNIPLTADLPLPAVMTIAVEQLVRQPMRKVYALARTGALQFIPTASFLETNETNEPLGYRLNSTGGASAMMTGGLPRSVAVAWPSLGALGITYDFGSKAPRTEEPEEAAPAQVSVAATEVATAQIYGYPTGVGFWLQGDGTGNLLSLVWRDARGAEHVSEKRAIDWRGWRYVTFDIPQGLPAPLQWLEVLRLEPKPDGALASRHGSLLANGFCFIYGANRSLPAYEDPAQAVEQTQGVVPAEVSEEIIGGKPLRNTPQRGGRR